MNSAYRVDVNSSQVTPVGMNRLKYVGNSWKEACRIFDETKAGYDGWNQPNAAYGVLLSAWNGKEYIIKKVKGFS